MVHKDNGHNLEMFRGCVCRLVAHVGSVCADVTRARSRCVVNSFSFRGSPEDQALKWEIHSGFCHWNGEHSASSLLLCSLFCYWHGRWLHIFQSWHLSGVPAASVKRPLGPAPLHGRSRGTWSGPAGSTAPGLNFTFDLLSWPSRAYPVLHPVHFKRDRKSPGVHGLGSGR